MAIIYLTPYDPMTLVKTGPSEDSGFPDLASVILVNGTPTRQGPRSVTYADTGLFYSDYPVGGVNDVGT